MAYVYNCCFWFSLRLGGIIIGFFSMVQSALVLVALGSALGQADAAREQLAAWMQRTVLSFTKSTFESILKGLEGYITFGIALTSIYLILCLTFVYGAYKCNIGLMLGYLAAELLRLLAASVVLVTSLMLLKENTMDIGQLIGASIVGGFSMLGMFYLWVCAVNLPVLIKEMEREEHLETIAHLQRLLERRGRHRNYGADADDLLPPLAAPVPPDVHEEAWTLGNPARLSEADDAVNFVNTLSSNVPYGYWVVSRPFLR